MMCVGYEFHLSVSNNDLTYSKDTVDSAPLLLSMS